MIARRICIALVLVAFTVALVPAQADALPCLHEVSDMSRPWVNLFTRVHTWLSRILGQGPALFVAAEGASISTGG
jgi:hypothetical protein